MKYLGVILVLCLLGFEYSYGFSQEYAQARQDCSLEGGYCINIYPPPPPRRLRPPRRRNMRRRGPRTKTRKGTRTAKVGGARRRAGGNQAPGPAAPAAQPPYQAPQQNWNQPAAPQPRQQQQQQGLFGNFNPMWLFFSTRKKRQAAEPPEQGETPQRGRNERLMPFLNRSCRKWEISFFSCQDTGGICCFPPL